MVRPRVGDFVYSEDEIKVMLEEIRTFKNLGVAGIVFGVLLSDGSVDLESARRIVKEALPLEITFHRAVDMTVDFESELVKISQIGGISRILTSGGSLSVSNGLPALERVFRQTSAPPLILPGSGVNAKTAPAILDTLYGLGLTELHASGGIFVDSIAKFRKPGMGMGLSEEKEWSVWQTRVENVSALRAVMDHWIKGRQ
ncbi:copper homeostasis protein cutC [Flagelloscypha sp. PMI_526]|nr:copper homeostasis protein cutC [Flagelloscypha sp. PMI_526]